MIHYAVYAIIHEVPLTSHLERVKKLEMNPACNASIKIGFHKINCNLIGAFEGVN